MTDVDWAALSHAYGTAEDVPGLLHDLRSGDAVTRERALDALYGGVHHQGDVYDSTLACIPHLLALVQDPDTPDRAPVLGLLTSIGASADAAAEAAGDSMPDPGAVLAEAAASGRDGDEWWEEYALAYGLLAGRVLAESTPSMVRLLADVDAQVRAAAAAFVVRRSDEPGTLLPALTGCLRAEPDRVTRQRLVENMAHLLGRLDTHEANAASGVRTSQVQAAVDLLHALAGRRSASGTTDRGPSGYAAERDPATVLAALTALARHAPDALPPDPAAEAVAALDGARGRPAPPAESGPDSGTMLSYLRDLRASTYDDEVDARLVDAVRDLHGALGGRLHDRHRLVVHELRRTAPVTRRDTLNRVSDLYGGWRVAQEDAAEAAVLLGGVLEEYAEALAAADGEGPSGAGGSGVSGARVSAATAATAATAAATAAELRCCLMPLTTGILDAAHRVAEASGYRTGHGWERDAGGQCLRLLISAGDERGAGLLGELLYGRVVPEELPGWCRSLGPHAAGVLPGLAARFQQTVERMKEEPDGEDGDSLLEAARLLASLLAAGFTEPAGVIAPFLDALADRAEELGTGLHRAGLRLLDAPDGLGPDADQHAGVLVRILDDRSADARVGAARALWHARNDAAEAMPALEAAVADPKEWFACRRALELAALMGPVAAPLLPAVRACLDTHAAGAPIVARAALALRAITGGRGAGASAADAALLTAWAANRPVRSAITAGLLHEDPTMALPSGVADLLREELADPRRLGNSGQPTSARMRYDTAADEEFRAQATALLARAG
jgi:hypothetical protein